MLCNIVTLSFKGRNVKLTVPPLKMWLTLNRMNCLSVWAIEMHRCHHCLTVSPQAVPHPLLDLALFLFISCQKFSKENHRKAGSQWTWMRWATVTMVSTISLPAAYISLFVHEVVTDLFPARTRCKTNSAGNRLVSCERLKIWKRQIYINILMTQQPSKCVGQCPNNFFLIVLLRFQWMAATLYSWDLEVHVSQVGRALLPW